MPDPGSVITKIILIIIIIRVVKEKMSANNLEEKRHTDDWLNSRQP